jgi:Fe-S cluster biogenesis protein NfuA
MFIQTEATPNPQTVKFIPGEVVLTSGTAEFRAPAEAVNVSPLAERLFRIQGVSGVFLAHDYIAITKDEDREWLTLKPLILGALFEHLSMKLPILVSQQVEEDAQPDTPQIIQIKQILDQQVRPAVARDGGDIVFHKFEKGIVWLKLKGACAGCPSSTMTLKAGIENMLRHYMPEVLEVRAVND